MTDRGVRREREKQLQEDRATALGWRIFGVVMGLVFTLGGAGAVLVNSVQAAQATGLVGTTGSFTVEYCYEDGGSKWPDYKCGGTFVADEGGYTSTTATLENADDHPEGERLDAAENVIGEGNMFRETGILATLGSLWWLLFGIGVGFMGFLLTRKWARTFKR